MTTTSGRYAAVTSTLALLVALGGTSYAAATIGTGDLKNNAVVSTKIKNGSVLGADIATGTITGVDVDESRLGRVPNADTARYAADAGTVAGTTVQPVHTTEPVGSGGRPHFVFVSDALDVELRCSTGSVDLVATTAASQSTLSSVVVNDASPVGLLQLDLENGGFDVASGSVDLLAGDDGDLAHVDFTYADRDHLVQGTLTTDYSPGATEPCSVDGFVTSVG